VDSWFGWENAHDAPFNSADFRLAWEEAINRSALADAETDGTGAALTVDAPGVETEPLIEKLLPIWPYNPSAAAKLVKQAGYPHGVNVTCYAEEQSSGGDFNAVDPILISDYKAAGINLTIKPLTAAGLGLMVEGKLPCAYYQSDGADTSVWGLENTYESSAWSQGVFDPAHVDFGTDTYVEAFQKTYTNSGAYQLFYDIEKQQKSVTPTITPLFTAPEVNVYQDDIKGWVSNSFNDDHWYAMYRTS
jgi:ABC-type transport system substrate-binding protein